MIVDVEKWAANNWDAYVRMVKRQLDHHDLDEVLKYVPSSLKERLVEEVNK